MLYSIKVYEQKNKKLPFYEWLYSLDNDTRRMIEARLVRMSLGNFGNSEPVGDGISELKIDKGPGYRIYYILIKTTIVLILCAGTKRTQKKDIENSKVYLKDYKMRGK